MDAGATAGAPGGRDEATSGRGGGGAALARPLAPVLPRRLRAMPAELSRFGLSRSELSRFQSFLVLPGEPTWPFAAGKHQK